MPLGGTVVLCRISKREVSTGNTKFQAGAIRALVVYTIVCVVLAFSALVRGEIKYLLYFAIGTFIEYGSLGLPRWLLKKRKTDRQSINPNQADAAITGLLIENTKHNVYGEYVPGKGTMAWLTEAGVYQKGGRHIPWSEFIAYQIDVPERKTHRIVLRGRVILAMKFRWVEILIASLSALAICVFAAGGIIGFRSIGLRTDVITDFASIILPLPLLLIVLGSLTNIRPYPFTNDLVIVIDEDSNPLDLILALLQRHLPSEDYTSTSDPHS